MKQSSELTIFYDSTCILCLQEMQKLTRFDSKNALKLIALNHVEMKHYPHIDPVQASSILHAQNKEGSLLLGLDATCQAWKIVGKHKWIQILRWPIIRFFADIAYRIFTKNRYFISYLLTGKKPCSTCYVNHSVQKSMPIHTKQNERKE